MKRKSLTFIFSVLVLMLALPASGRDLKVLYWNIQNGMWADQENNYDNFVEYVKSQDPDICVWCEAESRYRTGTNVKMTEYDEFYLPWTGISLRGVTDINMCSSAASVTRFHR